LLCGDFGFIEETAVLISRELISRQNLEDDKFVADFAKLIMALSKNDYVGFVDLCLVYTSDLGLENDKNVSRCQDILSLVCFAEEIHSIPPELRMNSVELSTRAKELMDVDMYYQALTNSYSNKA
jgi:hypothetical protein